MENLPQHIVIIPDGNRRWAKNKGLSSIFLGHNQGASVTEKIFRAALDLRVPFITFWGSSLDNVAKRPKTEVKFLFKLFEQQFKKLIKSREVHRDKVKVNVLGRWRKLFPEGLKRTIEELIEKTKNYKNHQLTFLMAYSGIDEMTAAIQKIAELTLRQAQGKPLNQAQGKPLRQVQGGSPRRGSSTEAHPKSSWQGIDEKLIKANLWTKDLPPIDLVIRTGGEPHWSSGFMMWDTANSQFYFTKTFYPDLSVGEFKEAIEQYSRRERRMGA